MQCHQKKPVKPGQEGQSLPTNFVLLEGPQVINALRNSSNLIRLNEINCPDRTNLLGPTTNCRRQYLHLKTSEQTNPTCFRKKILTSYKLRNKNYLLVQVPF